MCLITAATIGIYVEEIYHIHVYLKTLRIKRKAIILLGMYPVSRQVLSEHLNSYPWTKWRHIENDKLGFDSWEVITGLDNGLAPNRRPASIYTNDDPVKRHLYVVAQGEGKLLNAFRSTLRHAASVRW